MSQLAAQLRRLSSAPEHGHQGGGGSSSVVHPSLLFSAQVAADTDSESIYHLAINGLTALTGLQPAFAPFASSLFHPATVGLDRGAAKAEVQAGLNRSITSFLSKLSPFFLLPAATQCLEYCLRQYRVHEHNVEALLDCALPYHSTPLFARLLKLLRLQQASPSLQCFRFLIPLQQQQLDGPDGIQRPVLVAACLKEPALFLRIAATSKAHPHTAQLSLYCAVGVDVLSRRDVDDALLQSFLPFLLHGLSLSSHHSLEYASASVLLLVALARHALLDLDIVHAALRAMLAPLGRDGSNLQPVLRAVLSLCQSQQLTRLPLPVVALFAPIRHVGAALQQLMTECRCDALVRLLLSSTALAVIDASVSPHQPAEGEPTLSSLLSFLRVLLSSLPLTAADHLLVLDRMFNAAVDAAQRNSQQLPVRLVALLKQLLAAADERSGELLDDWVARRRAARTERERHNDLSDLPDLDAALHSTGAEGRQRKKRKEDTAEHNDTADTAAAPAVIADSSGDAERTNGVREKKRKRHRDRHAQVVLGSSATAVASHLLVHLTRGTRHALLAGLPGREAGVAVGVWQSVWSDHEETRRTGLTAMQRQQQSDVAHRFSAAQVEEVVSDCFHSASASLLSHLLGLTDLLSTVSAESMQRLLLRLLSVHSAVVSTEPLAPSALKAAHDSRVLLRSVFTFVSSHFLSAEPGRFVSFLPFYLEHCLLRQHSVKLNRHVRNLLSSLHALSPMLLSLPAPAAPPSPAEPSGAAAGSEAAAAWMADDNQRVVEVMARNVLNDPTGKLLQLLLDVFSPPQQSEARPTGAWTSGLVLSLMFELRSEHDGGRRKVKGRRANAGNDDLALIRQLFAAVSRLYASLPAAALGDESAEPSTTSFFSASATAFPAFLRFFLDRLIAALPPLTTEQRQAVDLRSPLAQLVREMYETVLVTSSASPQSSAAMQTQLLRLFAHHLSSPASILSFLTPLIVPSSSFSVPLSVSVASLQLLAGLLGRGARSVDALQVVPLLLSSCGSSSRAIRHTALSAMQAWQHEHKASLYSGLVSSVVAAKEDCLNDAVFVQRLVTSQLSASSASSKGAAVALMQAAADTSHGPLRLSLLRLLEHVQSPALFPPAASLLSSLLSSWAPPHPAAADEDMATLSLLVRRLSADAAASSADAAASVVRLLLAALSSASAAVALLALRQITPALCSALSTSQQLTLCDAVVSLAQDPPSADTATAAGDVHDRAVATVRSLTMPSALFVRRVESALTADSAEDVLQQLTAVLELLAVKEGDSVSEGTRLLRSLMSALSWLTSSAGVSDAVEYSKQLLLTAALHRVTAPTARVRRDDVDLSLLVSLLQVDSMSAAALAARNSALLLLAALAPLVPTATAAVLIPLFQRLFALPLTDATDSYSFSLLVRTIETVVPALLPAPTTSSSLSPLAWSLLSTVIFASALTTTSAAAYLQLLALLVRTVSPLYLHGAVAMLLLKGLQAEHAARKLIEKRAKRREEKRVKRKGSVAPPAEAGPTGRGVDDTVFDYGAFIHTLLERFSPHEQVESFAALLALLPASSTAPSSAALAAVIGDERWSAGERDEWHERIVLLVGAALCHLPFASQLLDLAADEQTAMQSSYLSLFRQLMQHQRDVAAVATAAPEHARAVLRGLTSAVQHLMDLLSVDAFVVISEQLLEHDTSAGLRQQTLQLLQGKITAIAAEHGSKAADLSAQQRTKADSEAERERDALTALVSPLQSVIAATTAAAASSRGSAAVCQLALSCLQSLVAAVCTPPPPATSQSAAAVAGLAARKQRLLVAFDAVLRCVESSSVPLACSALLCTASFIDGLQLAALALVQRFVPAAVAAVSRRADAGPLEFAALSVLASAIERLSTFLSPHLPAILAAFMQPRFHRPQQHKDSECHDLVTAATASLIRLLPPHQLLPHLLASYRPALALGVEAVLYLFSALGQLVERLTVDGVRQNLRAIFRLYQTAFDLRQQRRSPVESQDEKAALSTLASADVDRVEEALVSSFIQFVLRMNEEQMKAAFLQLLDWLGAADVQLLPVAALKRRPVGADGEVEDGRQQLGRALVFFKVVNALAGRLQSIFVPYYALCFDHAIAYLMESGDTAAAVKRKEHKRDDDEHSGDEEELEEDQQEQEEEEEEEDEEEEDDEPEAQGEDGDARSLYGQLVVLILSSLRVSLQHDSSQSFGKEQLDRLVPALQQQLTASYQLRKALPAASPASFPSFVESVFIPLCSQLALSLAHFHLWKPLHVGLLAASRSPHSAVRAAVVRTVHRLFEDVGSRYLVLLPETLPFIAEWLEDDDDELERAVPALVRCIEQLSGEKLSRYLES